MSAPSTIVRPAPPKLLEFKRPIILPAIEVFDTSQMLIVNTSDQAELPIRHLDPKIKQIFLAGVSLIELYVPERSGAIYRLRQNAKDPQVQAELGPGQGISLGQTYNFLKTADKSDRYISSVTDWSVSIFWNDGGWCWYASPIADLYRDWFTGNLFIVGDSISQAA